MDNFDRPIFVTGTPRSGTSMVAGTLAQCGAWTGSTVAGGPENVNGFYEHVELREKVVKGLLRQLGTDPLGVTSLPTVPLEAASPGLKERIRAILNRDGYDGERWLYKCPKMLLLWPLFAEAFPKAQWVVVWRPRNEIIDSCMRTSFMARPERDRDFWNKWAAEYWWRSMSLIIDQPRTISIESPRFAIDGDYVEAKVKEIGLIYDEDKVREFIQPDLLRRS